MNTAEEKGKRRKESANQAMSCSHQTLPCPTCSRICNPELDSSVIRGHAAPSKDFLPTESSDYEEFAIIIVKRILILGSRTKRVSLLISLLKIWDSAK